MCEQLRAMKAIATRRFLPAGLIVRMVIPACNYFPDVNQWRSLWRAAGSDVLTNRETIVGPYRNNHESMEPAQAGLRQLYQTIKPRRQMGLRIGKGLIRRAGHVRFDVHPATCH